MSNTAQNLYECIFIARQDVPAADVNKMTDRFSEIFQSHGDSVVKKEYWGLRTLAYEVKKNKKGHYVCLSVKAHPQSVNEFERNCKINEDVIKFISISVPVIEEGPSLMMQAPERSESSSS